MSVWILLVGLWLAFMCFLIGGFLNTMCGDRIAVFVLRAIDSPRFPEARMVAALIYQHPEQWTATSYSMEHPKVGRITGSSALSMEVQASFGNWEPSRIERRILFNAISWYRHDYMKVLLARALVSG